MTREEVTSPEGAAYADALIRRAIAAVAMSQYQTTGFGNYESILAELAAAREEVEKIRATFRKSQGFTE